MVIVFLAFAKEWISAELVAMGALMACVFQGILVFGGGGSNDALRVFSNEAVITVACMFILSAALETTGVIESLGDWFERVACTSKTKMLVVMIIIVSLLSGFVNNTPVVVIFMPIIIAICRRKNYKASKFLIPLSYAAISGGTMTMIGTSTNLLASGIYSDLAIKHGFTNELDNIFVIAPLGIIFVFITFIYLITIGRKLLPDRVTLAAVIDTESSREFISHAFIKENSSLVGVKYMDSPLQKMRNFRVIQVNRNGNIVLESLDILTFREDDEIIFKGAIETVVDLTENEGVEVRRQESEGEGESEGGLGLDDVRTESAYLMEGIIGPESSLLGLSLKELNFRQRFGVLILAVHRKGKNLKEHFEDVKLAFGDTLLVQGSREKMDQLFLEKDFVNLSEPKRRVRRKKYAPIAIGAIALFVLLGAFGGMIGFKVPLVQLAIGGALLVMVTRCIEPREAYAAIEWKVVFMILGMLGLGMAMQTSGLAESIAHTVTGLITNKYILLAVIYLLAAVLTEIVSNNAVAALLTPLAVSVAIPLELSPVPFVIAVMFGSSASFSTPIGYQTNTFVYGAGGYKFGDFFKAGFPLAVILWIVASILIPIFWPF